MKPRELPVVVFVATVLGAMAWAAGIGLFTSGPVAALMLSGYVLIFAIPAGLIVAVVATIFAILVRLLLCCAEWTPRHAADR